MNIPTLCWLQKKPIYQTNSNTPIIPQIISCRTLWKISEVNLLKIGGGVTSFCSRPPIVFLTFFHVDLVQILQGSKITPHANGPAGPDSTRNTTLVLCSLNFIKCGRSIIKILSCNTSIDDVDSHNPCFYVFL